MDLLPGLSEAEREVTRAIHVAAHIAVTLIKDGQWVANLAVHSATPRHWTSTEVTLAEDVADRTWAAAERAKAEAASAAAERRQAATAVAEAKEERLETHAKEERLETLEHEAEALEQREEALTAADEASRLGDAAATAKEARKA